MKRCTKLWMMLLVMATLVASPLSFATETSKEPVVDWVSGPTTVTTGDMADLKLDKNYVYLNKEDTVKMMTYYGNPSSEIEMGSVFPADGKQNWFVIFEYHDAGHVDDQDKNKINADELLKSIKEGTEEGNKDRKAQGMPEMHVQGWVEEPAYNEDLHSLAWGTSYKTNDDNDGINYECKILSREGYVAATLVCDTDEFETRKADMVKIVNAFQFKAGKRYADYVPGKDKMSNFGLAALVLGGVAAKKTGLLMILLLGLKKFWLLLVAPFAYFSKKFGKKKNVETDDIITENPPLPDLEPLPTLDHGAQTSAGMQDDVVQLDSEKE